MEVSQVEDQICLLWIAIDCSLISNLNLFDWFRCVHS